jgi:hypothetical protein
METLSHTQRQARQRYLRSRRSRNGVFYIGGRGGERRGKEGRGGERRGEEGRGGEGRSILSIGGGGGGERL